MSSPTSREIVLVVLVFISLLFFSSQKQSFSPQTHIFSEKHVLEKPVSEVETKIVSHSPGWTILTNLYVYKGTFYIVSDSPSSLPNVSFILSKGIPIPPGNENNASRLPTPDDIQIISKSQATSLFASSSISPINDLSFIINDPPQFITHYYHWSAELWYGLWRTYSSLSPPFHISSNGTTSLPPPTHLIFTHLDAFHWRDYASMNQFILRASFPSLTMEFIDDWRDRAELGNVFVFKQALLADRSAAMQAYNYLRFQRTAAVPFGLPGPGVLDWWMPIRNNVVAFAGHSEDDEDLDSSKRVITYVSRQNWTRRKLLPEHHENLVRELYKLRDQFGYEVNVVSMDQLSRQEQIRLAARTTILMGVHGNGLTSLLWMNPTPRSTIIEFFYPGGFAHDYEFTARAMGITHYGFWNDHHFTSPSFPVPAYPEGFQGNEIPIDGAAVARLCRDRLEVVAEVDD